MTTIARPRTRHERALRAAVLRHAQGYAVDLSHSPHGDLAIVSYPRRRTTAGDSAAAALAAAYLADWGQREVVIVIRPRRP